MPGAEASRVTVIGPPKGLVGVDLRELWEYRELLLALVVKNLKVRYKQSVIGIGWAVFQPLTTMVIFTIFFGRLAKIPSDGIPYPIFVYAGLLFWNLFSQALSGVSNSLVETGAMLKKVYFPRLIAPLSAAVTPAVDFAIALAILFGLMAYYGYQPSLLGIVMIPVLALGVGLAVLGVGLFLAALNAKFRDIRHALPFMVQMLMFLTPVIYPVSLVPERFRWLISLNPMAGVINAARSTLLGTGAVDWVALATSFGISLVLLFGGLAYFKKTEQVFADII